MSAESAAPITVQHDAPGERFHVDLDGSTAELVYRRGGQSTVIFAHTEVPAAFEGHGVGGALARTALDWARAEGLSVVPRCSFVAGFIRKHPEYADLVR